MTDPILAASAAREWLRGRRYVEKLLDDMCLSLTVDGVPLDPWATWREPRLRERADRVLAANRAMRDSLRAAGHAGQRFTDALGPPRDAKGRFVKAAS